MLRWPAVTLALAFGAIPAAAQSEAELKQYFEGRTVSPKLAMPGTEKGIDIYPGTDRPLDYPKYADRLKDYGTAIKSGEPVTVTKIKVKDNLVEFQLGGGGYGTFGDETSSTVSTGLTPKTKRERNLEAELKRETDPAKRRAIREEIDDLKAAREREDVRNRAEVRDAEEQKKQNIRQRRSESGSRFNIRYRDRVPSSAMTPEAIMAALGEYVDFSQLRSGVATDPLRGTGAGPERPRGGLPRKGMLAKDVDDQLGLPQTTRERKEGALRVQTREYSTPAGKITAEFVEGVLIRYTVTSE